MVKMPEVREFFLGELFYFFEFACGLSGYLLGVNPFNQPGALRATRRTCSHFLVSRVMKQQEKNC